MITTVFDSRSLLIAYTAVDYVPDRLGRDQKMMFSVTDHTETEDKVQEESPEERDELNLPTYTTVESQNTMPSNIEPLREMYKEHAALVVSATPIQIEYRRNKYIRTPPQVSVIMESMRSAEQAVRQDDSKWYSLQENSEGEFIDLSAKRFLGYLTEFSSEIVARELDAANKLNKALAMEKYSELIAFIREVT